MKFWCATAFMNTTELVQVSRLLDRAGYHGLMVSDHLCYPRELTSKYPYSPHADGRPIWEPGAAWPDPWVLIGAMSSVTTQLHFTTNVYIAGHRPILQVAKEVATAAVLTEGRVALGVGAGWMKEEYDLQGQDFGTRGKRLNEMIPALRELWKGGWVEWHGEHFDIPAMTLEPHPPTPVPIYTGGHTEAALQRAAKYADGWIGNAYPWDDAVTYIGRLRELLAQQDRDTSNFEIIAGVYARPSVEIYRRAGEELGITGMICMPWSVGNVNTGDRRNLDDVAAAYQPSIDRFAEEIVLPLQ
ncbi:MAG: rutA 1 [Acidimicrobiales bacterium]|nr:rutA 1 [Acidimicrobiales bacterium]